MKVTADAPVRFVPVMTTEVPTGPEVGVKALMVGVPVTVNVPADSAVPDAATTLICPVAPLFAGTTAVIWVVESTV